MGLEVVYASTDVDLSTTGVLKAEVLGATATSTSQDVRLSAAIRRASRQAEAYLGFPLTVQTYRETVAGYGRRTLMLKRFPVLAIKAVYDATDTGTAQSLATSQVRVEDRDAGLLSRIEGFSWTAQVQQRYGGGGWRGGDAIPLSPEPMPGQEERTWLVDYVAGYTYAGLTTDSVHWSTRYGTTSTGRTLPEDIESAVLLRAQGMFEQTDGVEAEKLGDLEVRYKQNLKSASQEPEPWQAPLDRYRVWV